MSEDKRLIWDSDIAEWRPLDEREIAFRRIVEMPQTEIDAKVHEAQEMLIKRRLENLPAAFSADGNPLTRDQAMALTLMGEKANWANPVPDPLKDLYDITAEEMRKRRQIGGFGQALTEEDITHLKAVSDTTEFREWAARLEERYGNAT